MRKRRMDAMFMGEYNHSIDAIPYDCPGEVP